MKKSSTFTFVLLITVSSYAVDFTQDYQNYKNGMELYGQQKFNDAEPLLSGIITSSAISDDQKIYASIALSDIYGSTNRLNEGVSVLRNTWAITKSISDGERDLGLVLSKTYRLWKDRNLFESYKIAFILLEQHPNDESVIFNFSVASLYMAGYATANNRPGAEVQKYFNETSKYSNFLITSSKNKEFISASFNLLGLTEDRQGNYPPAVKDFESAIKIADKGIYHRNLGWALYAGVSKKLKGKEKLKVIRRAYDEFNIAIKNGDNDPTTKRQIPNIEKLLKISPETIKAL